MSKKTQDQAPQSAGRSWLSSVPKKERKKLVVPELSGPEGDDFVIYFSALTLAENKKIRNQAAGSEQDLLTYAVIKKAEMEDGSPWFTVIDFNYLMNHVEAHVVAYMGNSIIAYEVESDPKP